LGLRSAEVARLALNDVDLRCSDLAIKGKARRRDRLPLPTEVGEALAAYLVDLRPRTGCREVFITCRAPRRGIRPDLVGDVVQRACLRAGLPQVGAHRLCHALATELLAKGAALTDIRQVLPRHQDLGPPRSTPRSTRSRCGQLPDRGRELSNKRPG
jgi:integrase